MTASRSLLLLASVLSIFLGASSDLWHVSRLRAILRDILTKRFIIHTENITRCSDPPKHTGPFQAQWPGSPCVPGDGPFNMSADGDRRLVELVAPRSIPRDTFACLSLWTTPRNSLSPGLLCSHDSMNSWASGTPQSSGIFASRAPLGAASKIFLFLLDFCSTVVSATLSHTCCAQSAHGFQRLRPSLSKALDLEVVNTQGARKCC